MSASGEFDHVVYSPVGDRPTDFSGLSIELSHEQMFYEDLADDISLSSQSTTESVSYITSYSDEYIANICLDDAYTGDHSIQDPEYNSIDFVAEPLRVVASRYCLEFHRCSPPNGQCVQQGRAEFCRCRIGFQGVDCAEASISSLISPPAVAPGSTVRDINAHYKPSLPTHHPIVSSRFPVASSINRTLNEYDSLATKESVRQLVHEILPPPSYYIHPDSTLFPPPSIDSDGGSTVFAGLACLLGIIVCGGTVIFVWQVLQKLCTTRAAPLSPGPRAVMSRRSAMKAEKKEVEEKKKEEKKEEEESEKDALLEDPVAMSKVQWNQ